MRLLIPLIVICVLSIPAHSEELRGGWVTAWNNGLFTQSQCDATIEAAKKAGLNALFVQVRKVGDAYYESSIEPRGDNLAPDFDPLAYMVQKGHDSGIKIHAWVNVCRIWREKTPPTSYMHMVNRHPDWLNKDCNGCNRASDGMFMDPAVPEARDYTASLIADIARRYDLDGIHLDYIRYPGKQWGYSNTALARYKTETGASAKPKPEDQKWLCWRMDQVTDLLKAIRTHVHEVKPNMVISAATVAWGDCQPDFIDNLACKLTCQNWRSWLNDGLIDANVPMNYRDESSSKASTQFRSWLKGFNKWSSGKPTYVGLGAHNNMPSGILRQIEAVRKAGLEGYVLFSFNESSLRDSMVVALSKQVPFENLVASQMFERGIRFAAQNQLGMAKVYLKKAVELDPDNAEAHFRLGRVYLRERNNSLAKTEFESALKVDTSHSLARQELDRLIIPE
jgi:uncharacterized lipoprotein YddW (UPF0748 family)